MADSDEVCIETSGSVRRGNSCLAEHLRGRFPVYLVNQVVSQPISQLFSQSVSKHLISFVGGFFHSCLECNIAAT